MEPTKIFEEDNAAVQADNNVPKELMGNADQPVASVEFNLYSR